MINIQQTQDRSDFDQCALLMSQSDPWITLQINYEGCLHALEGDFREVYIVTDSNKFVGFAILQLKGVLSGYIQTICIHPEYRNKGIGTTIVKYCEEKMGV